MLLRQNEVLTANEKALAQAFKELALVNKTTNELVCSTKFKVNKYRIYEF